MHYLSKRTIVLIGLLGSIILLSLFLISSSDLCRSNPECISAFVKYNLWDWANYILITPIILSLSLLTYILNPRVFESWKKFAVWAMPVILLLTYLVTRDTGGSNFFSMDFSLYFLAIIYGLFFLISLVIITVSALRKN